MDSIVDVEDLDPVSVNSAHDTVLLIRMEGSGCQYLSFPCDTEERKARLLVKNGLYLPDAALSISSCIQLEKVEMFIFLADRC